MKNPFFLFVLALLLGCSLYTDDIPPYSSYPDGFVRLVRIDSRIIDVGRGINTNEELLAHFDTIKDELLGIPAHGHRLSYNLLLSIAGEIDTSTYEYVIYVKPLNQNKAVLNENLYPLGMPIFINPQKWESSHSVLGYVYRSAQRILLVRGGNPEYWANPSYEHNGEKFTILPIGSIESRDDVGHLRFTYTVKKVKKSEVSYEN